MPVSTDDLRARQHLGRRLRTMREKKGLALRVAARQLIVPIDMLKEMENGQFGVPPPLVRAMTLLYDDPGSDVLPLAQLVRNRGEAADFAAWHHEQLAWEAAATRVCEVATTHIPELLQTSAYTHAVLTARLNTYRQNQTDVDNGVAALAERQHRLTGPPLLPNHVVIAEQALRSPVAGPAVMAAQWAHLLAMMEHSPVTIRVLPRSRSRLVGSQHGWRMLDFAGTPEPRWMFRRYGRVTAPTNGEEVGTAYRKFLRLKTDSLSTEATRAYIQQLLTESSMRRSNAVRYPD
ncbi:MAG TPA: Scr1 family TA system antitoxin-like transcriptional regulator [Pseudonocardiaceae bacterium]|nr:Scr1 family TA system antitoxin-like transcriptional regulator [Pseudonocardiaceae bacterium]